MDEKVERLLGIVKKVQEETGYEFSFDEMTDILLYTRRKCEVNGKGEDYIPILFENELSDYLMRREINRMGAMNRCARFAEAALV